MDKPNKGKAYKRKSKKPLKESQSRGNKGKEKNSLQPKFRIALNETKGSHIIFWALNYINIFYSVI